MNKITRTLVAGLLLSCPNVATYAQQALKVDQVKDSLYAIGIYSKGKYNIEWSSQPDSWRPAKKLTMSSSNTVVIPNPHPIVRLTTVPKEKGFYAAPRAIKLQGAANFRDLGGYPTKNGGQVRWGKIYRSADISKLTDADLEIIRSLNIKMVCDLRGEKEAELAPDKLPDGTSRILLPAGSENIGGANSFARYMKTEQSADSMMSAFYGRTDHLGKKYKPMFDELLALAPDKALLFHCTAGKDRTGVGAALILYALGVDDKIIYEDYELTNEYRKEVNEQAVKTMTAQGLPEKAARGMMAAKAEYLKTAFDAITKQFGSIDEFLIKEIDLTPEKKALLQKKFLY